MPCRARINQRSPNFGCSMRESNTTASQIVARPSVATMTTQRWLWYRINRIELVASQSLWSSDATWWNRSWSTLVRVMACCLTAPSHSLIQCWLLISEVLRYSPENNFSVGAHAMKLYKECENFTLNITNASPRADEINRVRERFGNLSTS